MFIRVLLPALCLAASSGCIYANVTTPLAYRAPTPTEVTGTLGQEVEGSACNHVILGLVAWGDGGYNAALQNARKQAGETPMPSTCSRSISSCARAFPGRP